MALLDKGGEPSSRVVSPAAVVMSMRSSRRWEVFPSISRALSEKRRSLCGLDGPSSMSLDSGMVSWRSWA